VKKMGNVDGPNLDKTELNKLYLHGSRQLRLRFQVFPTLYDSLEGICQKDQDVSDFLRAKSYIILNIILGAGWRQKA
jgi:hypothetical protein